MKNDIITLCEDVLLELSKFSDDLFDANKGIKDNRLAVLESNIGFLLPIDFKYFLTRMNGFSLSGTEVMGIDKLFQDSSLDKVYNFEHFEVSNKMPKEFFPFSNDGRGNHYCLDLSTINNGICKVVFWQWDFLYKSKEEVEVCNSSFVEWVKEVLIGWTLEDYNYDGSER